MADDTKITGGVQNSLIEQFNEADKVKATETKKNDQVNQQEFLTLLTTQLQNQDPLDPMNSEEFAVQLAQFSQVEQLIEINSKLDAGALGGTDEPAALSGLEIGSMAGFLGHQVVLKDQVAKIGDGNGPNVVIDIPEGAQSARIDLRAPDGSASTSVEVNNLEPGKQTVSLDGLDVPSGSYAVSAVAVGENGNFVPLDTKVTGTVEGFVLEPQPALLVEGEEVALEDVLEVLDGKG